MIIRQFIALSAIFVSLIASASEHGTAKYFESIKKNPDKLTAFLLTMPKGGDLHMHISGSSMSENLVSYAQNDNLCINKSTYSVFADSKCQSENLLDSAIKDEQFFNHLIDAWSMRNFQNAKESGHDHFFAAFGKFGPITGKHHGEILAEVAQRAAEQNEQYLEVMLTTDNGESAKLGKSLGWDPDFKNMREKLLAADFENIIKNASHSLDVDEAKQKEILACGMEHAQTGCNVKVRYISQVGRSQAPEMVFAQLLAGFELARKDSRVIGLNMVQPEDNSVSMHDYRLHMKMVGYLRTLYPDVHVSLHAGELSNEFVSTDGLKFHIHDAVEVAHADRIGHGVDIRQEDEEDELLHDMATKHVLVEVNLSSNKDILQVAGKDHPLPLYLQFGVPVALSTDDEGVTRDPLTTEFKYAVDWYQFSYATLKTLVRNSLHYSFLPGKDLWQDYDYKQVSSECVKDILGENMASVSHSCKAFLSANEKASMQWELEHRFTTFENNYS